MRREGPVTAEPRTEGSPAKALFISRAGADADFAAVIGEILEGAGYAVILQQRDFANRNFMERMHAALSEGARVVALLSPEYLRSDHCGAEWQNAIAGDPLNTKSRLILLRVAECEPPGLLSGLAYWDLTPIRDNRPLIQELVRDAVREDRREAVPSGPYWRAPRSIIDAEAIRSVPSFSGREKELALLSAALESDGAIAAVHGLGGVGKSSVAREYAWRNREQYSVIWWLGAQSEDGIIEGLLRLGGLFIRGLEQLADRRAAAQQVAGSALGGFSKPVLMIFDNIEDERLVRTWLPRTGARAMLTSRNAAWGPDVTTIALETWELPIAADYVRRESVRADLSEADARTIAESLGALPLALAHAAAYLRAMRTVTPARYLERINDHLKNAPRTAEYPQSIFATFNTAIAQAEREASGAAAVLSFAASFAPEAIPDELFRQPVEKYAAVASTVLEITALDLHSVVQDGLRLDEALSALDRLSLFSFAESSRSYSMHRLVQRAARQLDAGAAPTWRKCAVAVAEAAFPEVDFTTWPQCARLLPHACAALDGLPEESTFLPAAALASRCGSYLWRRGEFDAAGALHRRALAIREQVLGPDHLDVASSLNGLGNVHLEQGRYEEAAALHARALTIREKVLGSEDADVAYSLNNLGNVHFQQGRYEEAAAMHARALAIRERALGPDHANVAYSLNNLASTHYERGHYEEAAALHARALAIREKALGADHPDVAYSLHNLASVYYDEERYEEAAALYARALSIREKALGPDHPDVAYTLNDLGNVYDRQSRYEEAIALHARALAIQEKGLGPDHPLVAMTLSDLADSYEARGRREDAEPLYLRALAIREKALGPDHGKTKAVREKLRLSRKPLAR